MHSESRQGIVYDIMHLSRLMKSEVNILLVLGWVPVYLGVMGNGIADNRAKQATRQN